MQRSQCYHVSARAIRVMVVGSGGDDNDETGERGGPAVGPQPRPHRGSPPAAPPTPPAPFPPAQP